MKILSLFKRKPKHPWREDAIVFKTGGGWGDAINFMEFKPNSTSQRVGGHKTPKPTNGDVLVADMQSGRKAVFIFRNVKPCGDPPDMFFADVEGYKYFDEIPIVEFPHTIAVGDSFGGMSEKEALDAAYGLRRKANKHCSNLRLL